MIEPGGKVMCEQFTWGIQDRQTGALMMFNVEKKLAEKIVRHDPGFMIVGVPVSKHAPIRDMEARNVRRDLANK